MDPSRGDADGVSQEQFPNTGLQVMPALADNELVRLPTSVNLSLLALVVTVAGACSDNSNAQSVPIVADGSASELTSPQRPTAGSSITSTAELSTALTLLGIGCPELAPQPAQPPEVEAATCDGVAHLDIFVFADSGSIETWRRQVVSVYCASGILGAELPIVVGDTWAVAVKDQAIAAQVAGGLNGVVVHAGDYCSPP